MPFPGGGGGGGTRAACTGVVIGSNGVPDAGFTCYLEKACYAGCDSGADRRSGPSDKRIYNHTYC